MRSSYEMADAPNKLFLKFKKKLVKKLGSKALYNDVIDGICASTFGKQWQGCNSQDKIKWSAGFQIVNTDTSDKSGTHWIALYITGKTVYVYDSFGRRTPQLLKILTKQARHRKVKIQDSEHDAEQFGDSEICGHLCISWLMVAKRLGVRAALKI